ncbi:MAG: DUF362 domain-containing protein [Spirochaetota bacterium]
MPAPVFFTPCTHDGGDVTARISALLSAVELGSLITKGSLIALKTHFGEEGNTTHVAPRHIRAFVDHVKSLGGLPYLTETSVLYKSQRMNAVAHTILAYSHGFTYEAVGAPIIMSDGLRGNLEREVDVNGDYYRKVPIAADAVSPDAMIVISHATGHLAAGLGAALKNLGMGLSSRKGKLNQHSKSKPHIDREECTACEACIRNCPVNAIALHDGKARIDEAICIGCGECITVCAFSAVGFRWDGASADLQKKMAEHAAGVIKGMEGKLVYCNFLTNMTKDCDCISEDEKPIIPDIGILASRDPVAIDMATLDLTKRSSGKTLAALAFPALDPLVQMIHAERMGLGNRGYELRTI